MSLIVQNKCSDSNAKIAAEASVTLKEHKMFNFNEKLCLMASITNPYDSVDGAVPPNPPNSPTFEKNDNNLDHLKLNMLPENMFNEIQSSMTDWEEYMHCKEHEVLTKSIRVIDDLPNIRNCDTIIQFSHQSNVNNNSFTCSKIAIRSHEDTWTDDIGEQELAQKEMHSNAERIRGNKAYKQNDFMKACEHYSNCIALIPTKEAYNNRAQANIKLLNYTSALPDLDEVLKEDPSNVKALTRRAVCRLFIRMYHEALCDLQTILEDNPKNKEALSLVNDVNREISNLTGRKFKIRSLNYMKRTFEIDTSQLAVYAGYENGYVLETDKIGCVRSCVCGHCMPEDESTRFRSNTLRIKERPRWKRLTTDLLNELNLNVNATTNSHRETKNEYSKPTDKDSSHNSSSNNKNNNNNNRHETNKFYEKQVLAKNLANSAHSSYPAYTKITNNSPIALPAVYQSKSMKDSKNLNHQRTEGIENALQNLRLEEPRLQNGDASDAFEEMLKKMPPSSLREKFDSRLDPDTLTKIIRYVCENFQVEKDWPVISQYLNVIASFERFQIIIAFIDDKTKNDLSLLFQKAIGMNFENAAQMKAVYFK